MPSLRLYEYGYSIGIRYAQNDRMSGPGGVRVRSAAASSCGRSERDQKRAAASKPARAAGVSGATCAEMNTIISDVIPTRACSYVLI